MVYEVADPAKLAHRLLTREAFEVCVILHRSLLEVTECHASKLSCSPHAHVYESTTNLVEGLSLVGTDPS